MKRNTWAVHTGKRHRNSIKASRSGFNTATCLESRVQSGRLEHLRIDPVEMDVMIVDQSERISREGRPILSVAIDGNRYIVGYMLSFDPGSKAALDATLAGGKAHGDRRGTPSWRGSLLIDISFVNCDDETFASCTSRGSRVSPSYRRQLPGGQYVDG